MAKRERTKPSSISVGGEIHEVVLLRIFDRDAHGRPKQCMILYDEESVELKGGEEFLTVFMAVGMKKKGN